MGTGHSHGSSAGDATVEPQLSPGLSRALLVGVVVAVLGTLAGMVLLRPSGSLPGGAEILGPPATLIDARVEQATTVPCQGTSPEESIDCQLVTLRLLEGPDEGDTTTLEQAQGPGTPKLLQDDEIVVGLTDGTYYFADFQREQPMVWLAVIFAAAVLLLGRWRGARALAGLAISVAILLFFVLPAILDGQSPLAVSLVGASAVMLVSIYLVHGFGHRTTVAVLGTLVSLLLTGVLALVFVALTQLTGLSSEEAVFLQVSAEQINLQGLLLGGIIIGSLGVLDDVTVTQVSAVWEIHGAHPGRSVVEVYRSALRIGRDHIASTVNTLFLAYAGASLPLLILFRQSQRPVGDVLTGETVAIELVRTLVGSIGLVASVPITTALAAVVATGQRPELPAWLRRGGTPEGNERTYRAGGKAKAAKAPKAPKSPKPIKERKLRRPRAEEEWRRPFDQDLLDDPDG